MEVYNKFLKLIENKLGKESTDSKQLNIFCNLTYSTSNGCWPLSNKTSIWSNTDDLIFGINHCIWYITQFMELKAGDVINTGTPEGVGMGFKPEKYLKGGESIVTTIEGIGSIKNKVVNYK